ncbi:MAG: type VI secretion system contractile sheath small subunit [Gemmatimonadota bacterium]|nr:type VI secretion system contractile sheath small subunit [Gemmatimonadota bacterium]
MAESFQHRRKRQRPTRVNITYDVETGGAMVKKELPFIMGVMSDLSGDGADDLPEIADRQFVEIKPENFDKVLKGMKPRLTYTVDNKLDPDAGDKIGVELNFEAFDDFSPEAVARQVEPLRKLLEKRQDLADLKGKLATNRDLNKAIQAALGDDEKKAQLKDELEAEGGDEDGGS